MIFKPSLTLSFILVLLQLNMSSKGIELFSLSYHEDNGLKVNALHVPVYDEETTQKEIIETANYLKQSTIKQQLKEELTQQIAQSKQKEREVEHLIKKTEENIKIKKATLQKIFSEL